MILHVFPNNMTLLGSLAKSINKHVFLAGIESILVGTEMKREYHGGFSVFFFQSGQSDHFLSNCLIYKSRWPE